MEELFTKLREIVGDDYLITQQEKIAKYNKGTFPEKHSSQAIIKPANDTEIVNILAAIQKFNSIVVNERDKVSLYTVSSGKNWGYSAQEPSCDNAILMKLSRLKTIEEYDDKHGVIRISAGVTQQELYDYLQEQGGKFWMDATGSSPKCSVIGNTLERGFGHTTYGDHFAQVCNFEAILADGSKINTGLGQFLKNNITPVAANYYRWGIGPYTDGILTQSNFAIVTKMTVWLMPKPEHFEAFFISIKTNEQLPELIDALQPLKLNGIIKSSAHIANDHKAIQALSFYPWKSTNNVTPLPDSVRDQLKKKLMINAWSVSGAFYGTKAEVRVWKRILKKAVKGIADDVKFIDERTLTLAIKMKSVLSFITPIDFNRNIPLLEKVFRLKQGVPTNFFIPSIYWRKKTAPVLREDIDPTKDNVGLLWLAPIAPIDGKHVTIMSELINAVQIKYGYEPGLSITLLTERTLDCVISIVYDRDIDGEDEKAMACHDELFEKLTDLGYFPYRLSSHAQDAYQAIDSSLIPKLKDIKKVLDKNNLLSPNKYGI